MDKGTNKKVAMGSGHLYFREFEDAVKAMTVAEMITAVCIEENRMGYIKNGAKVEYKPTFTTEKDDLGYRVKEVLTEEEAKFTTGLFTWNGNTLKTLTPTARVSEEGKYRIVKIGGVNNDDQKNYVIIFHHEDKEEGDCWLIIVGRNTAGFTLTYAKDSATVIDAEFSCKPQDEEGTLIKFIEEIDISVTPGV